ncbi:hypothetical protein SEA_NICEHOUSE_55 [Rhodococcus phage NiceHouse]|nr:hypothetical protein SEA_NICEHOUSE_55 [Rhodococcus phage NiceHouse]
MKNFDVKIRNYNLAQYWSALESTGNTITGQINSAFSGIVFGSNPLANNRNIVSDSASSIRLSEAGQVSCPDFTDFGVSMVLYPEQSDVNLITFQSEIVVEEYVDGYEDDYGTTAIEDFGVKLNANSTITLTWPVEGVMATKEIIFFEEVSYLALHRVGNTVTMQLNNDSVTIEGDAMPLSGFSMGSSSGVTLVDKIAFSLDGTLPRPREYFDLFRQQRLDNVPRPDGAASFIYLNDAVTPRINELTNSDFAWENEYFYAVVQANTATSIWSVDRRTGFPIEYSIDQGATWQNLPVSLNLYQNYPSIIFRHQTDSDSDYFVDVISSEAVVFPMAFFDVTVDGPLHLPAKIGEGYYDVDQSDMTQASLSIIAQEDQIRTVEFLGELNETSSAWLDTTGATVYINGQPGSIANMKPHQIYHVIIVYSAGQDSVIINPGKNVSSSIAGIGASAVAYTAADAYYVFNTFAGNTFVSAIDLIDSPTDGVSPNAATTGEPVGAISVQWNS